MPSDTSNANAVFESLTPAQLAAVRHVDGPLLILAGPGSGKTRVITHRIAHLLQQGVSSRRILALTFTNKAADEMRFRLERLAPGQPVWMGTFHRFCAQMLRRHARLIGLQENFSIYDAQDAKKALKLTIDELDIDLGYASQDGIASEISRAKGDQILPEAYIARPGSSVGSLVERVYPKYRQRLLDENAVDFDDLLLHVVTLLRENPELRRSLDERYQYIMVDEYQDTNLVQYALARALSIDHPNLAVAGDPDQSIYGWRGANVRNILDFEHDYPSVAVVRLEQNYRSTPSILRVADQLISHNVHRKQKALFTTKSEAAPVRLAIYPTARDEADHIAARIAEEVYHQRRDFNDFAIFYRVNALSRLFEHALRAHNVPYQVVKGQEFYQRKEIKDVLAYLHLLNNPNHNVAFRRIINTPARKIGAKTIGRLAEHAQRYRLPMLEAARECALIETIRKPAAAAIKKFVALYDDLRESVTLSLYDLIKDVLDLSGYYEWLEQSDAEEDQQRLENLDELLSDAQEFDEQHAHDGGLEAFLEQTSLVADIDDWEQESDRVTLMTLHAAKGLEFPVVFIVAVEQGFLPHERRRDSSDDDEEERRLLFVGITRAEEELQLSMAHYRSTRGQSRPVVPSSFLMELPRDEMEIVGRLDIARGHDEMHGGDEAWRDDEFMQDHPGSPQFDEPSISIRTSDMLSETDDGTRSYPPHLFQQDMLVEHPTYGSGKIVSVSGSDRKRTASVMFFNDGIQRTFHVAFCELVPTDMVE